MEATAYFQPLIHEFEANANPQEAISMEKYMRHQFSFYGIKKPLREVLVKAHIQKYGWPDPDHWESLIHHYWNWPRREVAYTLQGMISGMKPKLHKAHLPILEYMILNLSWWDTVDYIAGDLVGTCFRKFPEEIDEWTEKWMESGNMWLQRSCILYQLKYKEKTDTDRLMRFILSCSDSREFFLQKAIGWALRQYSKTNPEWVQNFISTHEIKPLSVREGLKWIQKNLEK